MAASEQPAVRPLPDAAELGRRIDAYFGPLAARHDFSGIIRVERHGKLIVERRFGFADQATHAPHADATLYSAASVTKSIVAATLVALEQEGKLSLTDPVARWLPALKDHPEMTILSVLHHRAGLPRDVPDDVDLTATHGRVVGWLASNPGAFGKPGAYVYSNVGYALLASVIEAATGEDFAAAAHEYVLAPMGMTHSRISAGIAGDDPLGAKPYMPGPPPGGVMTPPDAGLEIGSSGLLTTAGDLARWGRALGQGRFARLLLGEHPLGSLHRGESDGRSWIFAQGSLPGYAAGVTVWPDSDVTVSYASNLFSYSVVNIEYPLRAIVYGDAPAPFVRPETAPLTDVQRALAGRYSDPDFGTVDIHESDGRMMLTMPGKADYWKFYLAPMADGGMFWRAFGTEFHRGSDGTLEALAHRQSKADRKRTLKPVSR